MDAFAPLCEPWPYVSCGDLTGSEAVTGVALEAASELLWAESGRRFGSCDVTLRPCRRSCAPAGNYLLGRMWPLWPTSGLYPGLWPPGPGAALDMVCGRCRGACGCTTASELTLPLTAQSVTSVVVDGVELDAEAYILWDDGSVLTRTDGLEWPTCQDWTVPVSGVGAWSVRGVFGRPVPALGQMAVGELMYELAQACTGGTCKLPANVVSVARQGVTQAFASPKELREAGAWGMARVDAFLRAVNPHGHESEASAQIWNPDDIGSGGGRLPGGAYGW